MLVPVAATVLRALWLAVEYPYLRRHRVRPAKDWDRKSALLWDVANAVEPVGMREAFGGEYQAYASATKRLIPKVF